MSEFKETVTKTQAQGVDETGNTVSQETRKVDTTASASSRSMFVNGVWFIVGVIDVLLGLRFTLKLLGANQSSGFVDFIYSITDILTAPFDSMFGVTSTNSGEVDSVFEPSIIVAALVYTLIGWGIVKLITLNRNA
jgi:hypothetical protein